MKKPTIFKTLIAVVLLLLSFSSYSQVRKNFTSRYTTEENADILVFGNNILNRDNGTGEKPNDPYDKTGSNSQYNDKFDMRNIDIDNETSFNSSSATLTIPQASKGCFSIVYAALYWSGTYQGSDRSKINQIRLKTSAAGATYQPISGTLIYDEGGSGVTGVYASKPYACFKDITAEVKAAGEGVYTIADLVCSEGKLDGDGGNSAGWSIFVIYKDPLLPRKFITSFDGFGIIRSEDKAKPLDIDISGFQANPFGDVNVKLAFSALEGDNRITGDGLSIAGPGKTLFAPVKSLVRDASNFFNSTITDGDIMVPGRLPNSINTLGYDAGVVKFDNVVMVNNKPQQIIKNNDKSATLRISTTGDSYFMFFNALSIEVIAPKIVLKKNVRDKDNNPIGGQPVTLDQELRYEIGFKNEGNDNAKNFTITDVLPNNVIFNGVGDILKTYPGITATYTAATRTLVFTVPDSFVVANGSDYTLQFKVRVVKDCNEMVDACSNEIKNIANSEYYGEKNTNKFGEGSFSNISNCNVGSPTSTNFLVGIDECLFSRNVSLCDTAVLKAANGYATYVWKDPNGVVFGGNNQQVTVTKAGTYTVENSGAVNCEPIKQTFIVVDYLTGAKKNPIKGDNIDPATGEVVNCVRDGKPFPKIFLCGLNDKRPINTGIVGAESIVWQETKDVPAIPGPDTCPYEGATNWTTVETGASYTADRPGVFRLVVNYGNTCIATYYFNVYQNLLDPKVEKQDIICDTKGSITVTNPLPNTGYVYSLDGVNYQASNVFNNVPRGSYDVQIRQTVFVNGEISSCPFHIGVNVEKLDFTTGVKATHPLCNGEFGTIRGEINNVPGQYKFILRKEGSAVEVQNSGLIDENYNTFTGVAPGKYEVEMSTAHNNCIKVDKIEVFDYRLTASANITKDLTACADGEITVTVTGGTPRTGPPPHYLYYVNGSTDYVTDPKIPITRPLPASGEYNIVVRDAKGCSVTIPPIKVIDIAKPTVTFNTKNGKCYNDNGGEITMVVSPLNSGYTVSYNVDGGAYTTGTTTNLNPGKYSVIVKYTYGTDECFDPAREVIVGGPASKLTASAGVAELSGCGPTGNVNQGLVRITNAQGGIPFPAPNLYLYSFDEGASWITSNQAYVNPRATPYKLLVKDAADCIYEMSGIVLEPKPSDPVFTVQPTVYTCDGKGTTTVTVTTDPSTTYTYEYYLGTTLNTNVPPNVFKDVKAGTYDIIVKYKLVGAPTFSTLLNEDFSNGPDTTSPGINNVYCLERQDNVVDCARFNSVLLNDGEYVVTKALLPKHGPDFAWNLPKDHTAVLNNTPTVKDGRFLAINIGGVGEGIPPGTIIYSKPIRDIIQNQDVKVTFYAFNLMKSGTGKADPDLTIELHKNGATVPGATVKTSKITPNGLWNKFELAINPGANTDLDFVVKTNIAVPDGSDLALDDILVYQLPKSCLSEQKLKLVIEDEQGFKATVQGIKNIKCSGDKDGAFSIVAENFDKTKGFFYSIDGGLNWTKSTVAKVDITGKIAGDYDVRVRYDDPATPAAVPCIVTILTKITTPTPFVVDASASIANCKTNATVTATAGGGVGPYTLVIKDKNSAFTKTFPADGILTNIPPGTYTITGTDGNLCPGSKGTDLVIDKPVKPTAEVVANTGLCFDNNKALITVKITGGIGPYSYQVKVNSGAYSDPSATFNGPTFTYTATATGNYDFLITDANNCEAVAVSQKIDAKVTASTEIKNTLSCDPVAPNATIEVTIDGGTAPYKYVVKRGATTLFTSGSITGPKFTYSADLDGTYTFEITDANGCTFNVDRKVDKKVDVTGEEKVTPVTCFGANNGSVILKGLTGVAPFTYQFNGTGAFTTKDTYGPLVGSVAGTTYTYIVKDDKGCTKSYSFKVFQPADLVGTASITTAYNCDHPAEITVSSASVAGGNGSYTFTLNKDGVAVAGPQSTYVFGNLTAAGVYTVTITDAKLCTKIIPAGTIVALNPPKGMTLTPTAVTCPTNKSNVTITNVVNGAGVAVPTTGLQYRMLLPTVGAYQSSNAFNGLNAGVTYKFEVVDANNCKFDKEITILSLPTLAVTVKSQNNVVCLGDSNASAVFTVSGMGNNVAYSYKVDSGAVQTGTSPATGTSFDISVPNLNAGTHSITVTNTATTCFATQTVNIAAPAAALTLNLPTLTHVTCKVKGSAIINVTGGWTPYSYVVTPTAPAGAAITQNTKTFSNLSAGTYSVLVTDLNGCTKTQNFTINDKVAIVASIDATSDFCAAGTGATIRVTPNTATNYVYSLDNGATQNNGTFTKVTPGAHTITVTDTATGCSIDLTVPTIASPIGASIALDKDLDCSVGSPDAIIRVYNITNGYPDYKYRVNTTGAPFTGGYTTLSAGQTSFTHPVSTAATYYFEITDTKNCTVVVSQKVNAKVNPIVTAATPTAVKCKGASTGTITVTTNPVAGTYTYVLTPTAPTTGSVVSQTTSNVFTNVKAGTYSVTVIDAKSCTSSPVSVTVTEPALALSASASATKLKCGAANASEAATVTVTASNGTPFTGGKYKYDYGDGKGFVDSNTFTTDTPGLVTITVKDANDCTTTATTTILALKPPTALSFNQQHVITCDPAKLDTDLTVLVANGVSPFRFEITSTTAAIAPAAPVATGIVAPTHTFANLAPGKYYFTITDANGCKVSDEYEIVNVTPITVNGVVETNVSCNGVSDGKIKFTVGGNATGFTYVLKNTANATISGGVQTGNVVTYSNLPGGTRYTITVQNPTTQCSQTAFVDLANPTVVTVLTAVGTKVYCDKPNTTITVTASGGTGTLYYAVVSAKAGTPAPVFPADFTNTSGIFVKNTLVDGESFNVFVRDAKGCPATRTVSVVRDAVPTINPIPVTCYTGGSLNITMSGTVYAGSGILYGVDGNYSTNPVKTIPGPGSYDLTIKDDNGCISPVFVLNISNQLKLTVTPDKDVTCSIIPPFTTVAAQVTLSAVGGGATYTYEVRKDPSMVYSPITGNVFTTSTPGDYYFRVTSGGCSAVSTVPVTVTTPMPPVITAVATGTKCTSSTEGTIQISVTSGGVRPFTYTIDNWLSSNTTGYFTDLAGGTGTGLGYTYQVRDAKGCVVSGPAQVFVVAPDPITFGTSVANIECDPLATPPGSTLGSITVINATGGTGQYTYYISNNFGYTDSYTTTAREDHKFDIINFGIYTVEVRDQNSCSVSKVEVMASPPNDLKIDINTASDCTSGGTAIVTAVASVGSGNYEFGILEFNTPPYTTNYSGPDTVGGNIKTFNPLIPGVTYTFVVHDLTTNCYFLKTASGPIPPASSLVGTPTPENVTCKGLGDGRVTFTVTGYAAGTTSVDYQIFRDQDNAAMSPVLNEPVTGPSFTKSYPATGAGILAPGRYYIVFTEKAGAVIGCKAASTMFEIKESTTPLSLLVSSIKNDNCNPKAGIVKAQAAGGAGSFLYQIVPDNGSIGYVAADDTKPTAASFLPTHSTGTFYVDSGNYLVWVKDANGCITEKPVTVILDPNPVFALSVVNHCALEGAFAVTVTVTDPTPSMAPYKVSVNGGNPVTLTGLTYTASGLNSGMQTIIVTDKNGCPITHTININATPIAGASIGKVLACSVTGTVVEDAIIHVEVKNGTTPYTYQVKKGSAGFVAITPATTVVAGVTSFDYVVPAASADTYIFRITDLNGCPIDTNPVTIDPIVPIVPAANAIQPLCFGGTGSIVLSATGGKGPYTYNFNGLGFSSTETYPVVSRAAAYPYIVKDALGCEASGSVILGQPTDVVIVAPVITPLSCGPGNVGQDAKVVLSATGGTGTYEYSFNNSAFTTQNTYFVSDTKADQLNIPFSVRDANGCPKSGTVDIFKLNAPTGFNLTQGLAITCTQLTTTVAVSAVANGVGTVTYQIVSPASEMIDNGTTATFSNIKPNIDYVFQVKDANGCIFQKPLRINDVTKIKIVEQSTTGITCSTAVDGKATFFVSGFGSVVGGTYRYELDGAPAVTGQTNATINLTGLAAGPHSIKVYDDVTNCEMTLPFAITAPPAALTISKVVTPLGCSTFGQVVITAQFGWGNYTYTLTNGATILTNTNGTFAGLTQTGLYTIAVKDANGCELTDSFTLTAPVKPTITIDASNYCYVNDNSTTINVSANSVGTPHVVTPYEFSIDGTNWQTSGSFPGLKPGDYTITVKDKFGCTDAISTKINGQLFASVENTKDLYCTGVVNGTIRIKAVGGYPVYSYTVAINGGLPSAPVSFANAAATFADYTVTTAGSYVFTVIDTKGCSYPIPAIVMASPAPVVFTATPTSPSCSGTQGTVGDGSILVNLATSNTNPDYTYTIQRTIPAGGAVVTQVNNPLFTDLIAGTYTVTVTSARGCSDSDTVVINPPTPVVASAVASPFTCSAVNTVNATIVTVTGAGGVGTGAVSDYTYSDIATGNWKTTNTFNVTDNGSIQNRTFYVKDANGCIDDVQISINPFPKLISATTSLDTKADCINAGEIINVVIAGGTANFEYQVYKDGVLFGPVVQVPVGTSSFKYTAVDAGHSYQFLIKDKTTLCTVLSDVYNVPLFNTMKVIANASAMVSCDGKTDGKITITLENYTGTYNYRVLLAGAPVASGTGINAAVNNPYIITGLGAGRDYVVEVTQTAYPSCMVLSNKVTITQPPVLNISGLKVNVVNQNCNTKGAVLTVDKTSIVGGTPDYIYAFVPAGTLPVDADYQADVTKTIATTKIAPLFDAWDVYVKDVNGCYAFQSVQISVDPLPVITDVKVASQCFSAAGYRIDVTASGVGPLKYSLDGQQFQDDSFFTVFAAGNYTVTVMDKNQCKTTAAAPVTILDPLELRATISIMPVCNTANGEITLEALGGTVTPPNSYVYTKDNWVTSQVQPNFTNLAPGVYTFKVRDIVTLCEKEVVKEIEVPTLVTGIVLTPTAVSCKDGLDGSITVTLAGSNNNPKYTYSLTGPAGFVARPAQDLPIFNDLPYGLYTVTVLSGRGCPGTASITVPEPLAITVGLPTVTQYVCNAGTNTANNATITVAPGSVTGGSGNYVLYEFFRNGVSVQKSDKNTYTEFDYLGGTYSVTVFDSNKCQGQSNNVIIAPYANISDLKIDVTKITCRDDESIVVSAISTIGTLPALSYTLEGVDGTVYPITSSPTGSFAGLKVGLYKIVVTNTVTGCSIERFHKVDEPNTFKIVASDVKNVICFGDANGSATLTLVDNIVPTDEAGIFTYVITHESGVTRNGVTTSATLVLSNLISGTYKVDATLSNSPFCPVHTEFSIEGPAAQLKIKAEKKEITCAVGSKDGEISVSAEGGWPGGYQYKLVGPMNFAYSSAYVFQGLTPGSYTVFVKDSKGCEVSTPVQLNIPTPINVVITGTPLLACFDDENGVVTINSVTGGSGNYTYTLNGTLVDGTVISQQSQGALQFTGLKAGTYSVTVNDSWSCKGISNTVTIAEPTKVKASLEIKTNETCKVLPVLTLTAVGGTAPYFYSQNGTGYIAMTGTSIDITLPFTTTKTTYSYFIKDANGCTSYASNSVEMPVIPALTFEKLVHVDITCKGDASGTITAIAKGGLGNYTYTLQNEFGVDITPAPTQLTPGVFTQLTVGKYIVKVNSVDCDTPSAVIEIKEPNAPLSATTVVTDVTCNGYNNGMITVNVQGGTGIYKYAIEPEFRQFFDKNVFENLKPGFYDVLVQDENECYVLLKDVEVKQPDAITVAEVVGKTKPEYCKGDKDGYFEVEVKGGTAPYSYSLDNDKGPFTAGAVGQTIFAFPGLIGGAHTVYIIDSKGCFGEEVITLPIPVTLNPTVEVFYDCVDNAQANRVVVSVDPSNYDLSLITYELDGDKTTNTKDPVFKDVAPGVHIVTAIHENGCFQFSKEFTIVPYTKLTLIETPGQQEMNVISVTAAGGAPVYEYSFEGGPFGSSNKFKFYKTGTYKIQVRDQNGCIADVNVYREFVDVCLDDYFTPNGNYNEWGPGCTNIYTNLTFSIFDRYGREVGKYRYGQKWDGKYNGVELPSGDYWYVLKLNDERDMREFVGHFTLYR
ncbi:T9SS type B sorting domain-containing protein [Flavobacterium poyangense]|uniref:T9SS type B sorting domain-containing protein n=1 Tax=Flavobacterium poyangense TaxID=2204302 RepID=UPI0014216810|nr:T9SS type B sorting domain-containing protein [Flavobacterium sp. JXAS1]